MEKVYQPNVEHQLYQIHSTKNVRNMKLLNKIRTLKYKNILAMHITHVNQGI